MRVVRGKIQQDWVRSRVGEVQLTAVNCSQVLKSRDRGLCYRSAARVKWTHVVGSQCVKKFSKQIILLVLARTMVIQSMEKIINGLSTQKQQYIQMSTMAK